MATPLTGTGLGFRPGDHACAFYWSTSGTHAEMIDSYVSEGLQAGDKCVCFIDKGQATAAHLANRPDLGDNLILMEPDGWYVPKERFSAEEHIARLDAIVQAGLADGFSHVRLVGDASFVFRRSVDPAEWFRYETQVNDFSGRYPQYLLCLYDLDCFDGSLVTSALRTHPLMFVNGTVLRNPFYASPGDYERVI